jgi:hypothetical protein
VSDPTETTTNIIQLSLGLLILLALLLLLLELDAALGGLSISRRDC